MIIWLASYPKSGNTWLRMFLRSYFLSEQDTFSINVKGNLASESLCRANITCNKNGIPFDTEKPMITSGIRLGSQAATTRGFGLKEFEKVGNLITKVIKGLSENPNDNSKVEEEVKKEVVSLCSNFPIYKNLNK